MFTTQNITLGTLQGSCHMKNTQTCAMKIKETNHQHQGI
jgi:hypothetical protein